MIGALGAKDILIQLKGDTKDFKGAMKDADSSMGSLTKSVKAYGPAMVAAFAVGTAAFIGMTVKMAAAEEVVNRQTESMLKSQGIMWDEVQGEVTDYINELERLTAYGDTDLQMAFNRMSSSGLEYNEVMKSMKMVTDIAYTRNIDLVAAADLVSKAYNGQASSLKRYGIVVEAGITGMEAVNAVQAEVSKNFADAADRTETLEGKMDLLTDATDDFKEAMGKPLLEPLADFVGLLAEGATEGEGFAATIGKILAAPIEMVVDTKEIEKLGIELQKLESIKERTWEEDKRRSEVIFEMQQRINGVYVERNDFIKVTKELEEEIAEEEESLYFIQLRKMGATDEYIDSLKEQLQVEKDITEEGEKQLKTMRERATEAQRDISVRREGTGGTSSMSAATAAMFEKDYGIKVSPSRINPNITGGNTSGAP